MPLDAVCLEAVLEELRPRLLGLRIDKVQQPARDQVILLLRGNQRLLLNAGANAPRIQLTELTRDNPAEPPMFCMLLRKHLVGARVADIVQPGLERLRKLGFKTAAMALRDDSVSIDDPRLREEEKLAIVLGTEGDGLASVTIADCDYTVRIPMTHGVDSLNVAAASAVAFWELRVR